MIKLRKDCYLLNIMFRATPVFRSLVGLRNLSTAAPASLHEDKYFELYMEHLILEEAKQIQSENTTSPKPQKEEDKA